MALTKLSSFVLANTGVTSGTYGGSTPWQSMTLSVNPEGQITSIANVTPSSLVASGSATSNIIVLATSVATDVVNTYAHAYTTGLFVANTDQSIQVGVQNFANTQNASADFALYNNLGTDTSNYVDLGIISQNYNTTINSFTAANPGDAYLYSNGSNMLIGAYTAGKAIKFFVNGYNAANVGVVINAPNTVSTTTSTGTMTIAGGLGVSGNVNIGGTLNVTGNITFSNTTINNVTVNTTDQVVTTNTTSSTSTTTGSIVAYGGLGVVGNIYAGGTINGTLASTGVTTGTYGGTTQLAVVTVNAAGQITYAANVTPSIATSQLTGTISSAQLASTGVTTGTYGGSSAIPVITINSGGQITYAGNVSVSSTAIVANSGQITANAYTGIVALGLATTGTAATYGNSTTIPVFVTDAYGRVISVANTAIGTLNQNTTGSANSATYLTGTYTGSLTSSQITTGLGFTPYNSTNPSGYLTSSGAVTSLTGTTNQISVSGSTGSVTLSLPQAIATTSSVQHGSLGIGVAADGTTGDIIATGLITSYYSDERLKTNLGIITDALEKVKSLSGFYYEANQTAQELGYTTEKQVGVSAQEVQKVLPEIVSPAPIDNKYLTVHYERLVPLLIEAIKEQQKQIDALMQKVK